MNPLTPSSTKNQGKLVWAPYVVALLTTICAIVGVAARAFPSDLFFGIKFTMWNADTGGAAKCFSLLAVFSSIASIVGCVLSHKQRPSGQKVLILSFLVTFVFSTIGWIAYAANDFFDAGAPAFIFQVFTSLFSIAGVYFARRMEEPGQRASQPKADVDLNTV